ncbi:MAG TPA: ribosome-associated translation inhibitor RaiA [Candidatus Polarisedimenticolia bacterium]
MTITYTGRKAHLTPALKAFTEEKLGKLQRFLGQVGEAHLVVSTERHRHLAEIVLKGDGAALTAKAEAADFHEAIAVAVDRLIAQGKKHRELRSRERKRRGRHASPRGGYATPARNGPRPAPEGGGRADLVRMGRIPAKPMSLEEAMVQFRESRDPFLAFRDVESQQLAVIFRRPDGRFGLVEEEV